MSKDDDAIIERVETLLNVLVARATGEATDWTEYPPLRMELMEHPLTRGSLPRFVRTCRFLDEFWGYIQPKFSTYRERRRYLREAFAPLLAQLEGRLVPVQRDVAGHLESLDPDSVLDLWDRARSRVSAEPDGAITLARTLLESVCKIILEEAGEEVTSREDLPALYKRTARTLRLGPQQHSEQVFRQILSGCSSVVQGLGALRNALSDAHGRTKRAPKPAERHAKLAVNLAGAMSMFLVETWRARQAER